MKLTESEKDQIRGSVKAYTDYGQGAVESAHSKTDFLEEKLGELLIYLVENHIMTIDDVMNI